MLIRTSFVLFNRTIKFVNYSSSCSCRQLSLLSNARTHLVSHQFYRFLSSSGQENQSSPINHPQESKTNNVIVTDRCLKRIEEVLDSNELLRVGVRGGGCSGFEYEFSIDNKINYNHEEDVLFVKRVVIDRESLDYLFGSKIDYEDELIRSGFCVVDNPLADKSCSCGVSFSLKMDDILDDLRKKS